ncbi:MAG: iron-sulfur cluster insertion protein ErpA [Immundisolibacterales bacterium]|nr:iron-sulfur cluster insertion protein ErpA [Immundisolibacterales bacterium]
MDTAADIDIRISDRATAKAKEIFAAHADSDAGGMLRVYVEGGGCSGFQYGFDLERDTEADDYVIERDGVRLLVDPLSYQYIVGSEIDYQEDLQGSQFVVRNPNASTTCGCGLSFAL